MFISYNKVRMHDTDMAGILYFPRQYRFAHDALEDLLESHDLSFEKLFHHENFTMVIVHAEADYLVSLKVGDKLEVHIYVERIGQTSFTIGYRIYRVDHASKVLTGTVKTVHVVLDPKTRTKIPIPDRVRKKILEPHLIDSSEI